MSIVGGFDVHRRQITFDYVDTDTGRSQRGRITPACRAVLRRWLAERFAGRLRYIECWHHRGTLER
jgi:transposase